MAKFVRVSVHDFINLDHVRRAVETPKGLLELYDADDRLLGRTLENVSEQQGPFLPAAPDTHVLRFSLNVDTLEEAKLEAVESMLVPVIAWNLAYPEYPSPVTIVERLKRCELDCIAGPGDRLFALDEVDFAWFDNADAAKAVLVERVRKMVTERP